MSSMISAICIPIIRIPTYETSHSVMSHLNIALLPRVSEELLEIYRLSKRT